MISMALPSKVCSGRGSRPDPAPDADPGQAAQVSEIPVRSSPSTKPAGVFDSQLKLFRTGLLALK